MTFIAWLTDGSIYALPVKRFPFTVFLVFVGERIIPRRTMTCVQVLREMDTLEGGHFVVGFFIFVVESEGWKEGRRDMEKTQREREREKERWGEREGR